MTEQEIYIEALQRQDEADRQRYLAEACADNPDLRVRVEKLLEQANQLGSFMEHPPVDAAAVQQREVSGAPIDATALHHSDSTCDDDEDSSKEPMKHRSDDHDEISLGYLQPSSHPNSLGRLGHYEILEVIGRGAFGTVLRAFDAKLQRVVAVKVLNPEMAATSPARKRFKREAISSGQLRHDNVVSIYSVEDEPIPYLVMEYIPGKTLQQRLDEKGPLELADVLRLGKQIADALAAAHSENLIHRDVKPGNILLEGGMDDRVKITDFGLARTADDASMTQSGVIAGTPMYMAPEQALGKKIDQRADLFSFGSVLYQMVSGRPPFRAPTSIAVLKRVADDTPRPIQEIIPEVPDWMCELIGHLHAKDPDERYGSAQEVSEILADCLSNVQQGREPKIPHPSQPLAETKFHAARLTPSADAKRGPARRAWYRVAAVLLVSAGCLGITEATGVSNFTSTIARITSALGPDAVSSKDLAANTEDGPEAAIQSEVQEKSSNASSTPALPASVGSLALAFDGDDDYVATPLHVDKKPPLTVEATVQMYQWPDKVSSEIVSDTENGGFSLGASYGGFYFSARVGDRYVRVFAPASDEFLKRPVALAGILTEHGLRMYVDGRQVGQTPINDEFQPSTQKVSIGTSPGDGQPNDEYELEWSGRIYALRISTVDRYSTEYDSNAPLTADENTLALYRFDEGKGDVLNDSSSHGFHGTITGAKWVSLNPSAQSTDNETSPSPVTRDEPLHWPADAPPPAIAPFAAEQAIKHQKAWADYLGVPLEKVILLGQDKDGKDVNLAMVLIPPGEFLMGSTEQEIAKWREQARANGLQFRDFKWIDLEGPQRRVTITRPFYMSRTEITNGQFRSFVTDTGYQTEAESSGKGSWVLRRGRMVLDPEVNWQNIGFPLADTAPVIHVNWVDAVACCEWLSGRDEELAFALPTEAQWEYACRAGTTTAWFCGDDDEVLKEHAIVNLNWMRWVGHKKPNPFGLYDMHGNVWEWCRDSIYNYRDAEVVDPVGPGEDKRIIRGGNFYAKRTDWHSGNGCRSAVRYEAGMHHRVLDKGFRVVAALPDDVLQAKAAQ